MDNATRKSEPIGSTEESLKGDLKTITQELKFTIENYIPEIEYFHFQLFPIPYLELGLYGVELRCVDIEKGIYDRLENGPFDFANLTVAKEYYQFDKELEVGNYTAEQVCRYITNVTIEEVKYEFFYGDEPLLQTQVEKNPSEASFSKRIIPLAKTVVTFRWSKTINVTKINFAIKEGKIYRDLTFRTRYSLKYTIPSFLNVLVDLRYRHPIWILVPVASFAFFGFFLAFFLSFKMEDIRHISNAFHRLSKVDLKEDPTDELDILKFRPQLLRTRTFQFFSPAITLFKMAVQRHVTKLKCMSKLESHKKMVWSARMRAQKWNEAIKNFLDEELTKPSKTLFDSGSAALILVFLASLGITFSWNVGAIGSFVLAFGLVYLCCNLGFLTFLFRKSTKHWLAVISLFFLIVLVMTLPELIMRTRIKRI